jgi:serine protease Do
MRATSILLLGANLALAPFLSAQANSKPASLRELSTSYEDLAARVRPAVVQIFSTGYVASEEGDGTAASSLISTQRATGSGVILTADGYIVTNNHVVQGARKIEVRLASTNRSEERNATMLAKLVGADRVTDVAVLKVDRANLPFLPLGNSNELKQGQVVMAFGNPLGLEGSVSMGIVSSISRRLHAEEPLAYVQTDAPINPGNSGGPLVDVEGRVIGINTFILSQSGGSEGLGFAIPSNAVRNSYDQIRKDGHVHRGQLGIVAQTINPAMAKGLKLSQDWGVVASDVTPDGPADKEGVKVRDIVLSLNGAIMEDAPQLETAISRLKLSEVVSVRVLRDGKQMDFTIPVIERDDDPQRFADMVNPEDNLISKLGVLGIEINKKLSDMLPGLRREYGIVVAARAASPPYSGPSLEPGDVIYQFNQTPTLTVKTLRALLDEVKPGDSAVLQIQREGKLRYITIELE